MILCYHSNNNAISCGFAAYRLFSESQRSHRGRVYGYRFNNQAAFDQISGHCPVRRFRSPDNACEYRVLLVHGASALHGHDDKHGARVGALGAVCIFYKPQVGVPQ